MRAKLKVFAIRCAHSKAAVGLQVSETWAEEMLRDHKHARQAIKWVLNPPGGASNNIFGYNNEPVQKTPIRNNPDNVNRGNNDIFHQSPHAAAAQPKSRAPRSAFNPITGEPYDQPKATSQPQASAPEPAAVNNTNLDPSPGAVAAGVEEKPQEPQNDPAPQPAAAAAPAAQKRQQSGGSQIFGGGADDASQHRSTRVSQPPGGRSTKLW